MDKYVMVAPVGRNANNIFVGIRDFPTEKLILLSTEKHAKVTHKVKKDMEKFRIPVKVVDIKGNPWENLFEKIAKIKKIEGDNMLINTSSADRTSQCALTSAAFVNGVKAFSVENNETMLLPILKFSYYKILTDKKMEILKLLYAQSNCCSSLDELSKKSKMSLPLTSYHVNGTLKSEGLKDLGLINVDEGKGKTAVKISTMGRMLIKGYVN
jgi:predicted transcriptional regulator